MRKTVAITLAALCLSSAGLAQQNGKQKAVFNRYGQRLVKKNGTYTSPKKQVFLELFNTDVDTIPGFMEPYTYVADKLQDADFERCETKEFVFKKYPDYELTLAVDIPTEQKGAPYPVLVVIHGGGFKGGSYKAGARMGRFFASHGIASVRVCYTLIGKGTIDNALSDLNDAIKFVAGHARELQLDMTRIGFTGSSAGAALASYMGMTTPGTKLLIARSGPSDFEKHFYSKAIHSLEARRPSLMRYFGFDDNTQTNLRKYSPIYQIPSKNIPAVMLFHGTFDTSVLLEQADLFEQALKRKKAPVVVRRTLLYGPHGSNASTIATYEDDMLAMLDFAKTHFKK